jgi:hypothetical protein
MIVIPMAGESRRFFLAGYTQPKYRLMLKGKSLFDHAVASFAAYFETEPFLIILRGESDASAFVKARLEALGVRRFELAVLDAPTAGQAETVAKGMAMCTQAQADTPLTIFNIDTFRPGFRYPQAGWFSTCDGYLEVFRATDTGLSFVRPDPEDSARVAETAEKRVISDLASNGLYYFRRAEDYLAAYAAEQAAPTAHELFVAPLYNHLIRQDKKIYYILLTQTQTIVCGTPAQYEALNR